MTTHRRRGARSQRGQALVIVALAFVVLVGFAALAIDGGHDYLVHRTEQTAADMAALAGGKALAPSGSTLAGPPVASTDNSMTAVHDFAANNGVDTVLNTTCDTHGSLTFATSWFDTAPGSVAACAAATGFIHKVTVNVPPVALVGSNIPPDCGPTSLTRFNCIQVVVDTRISNYLAGAMGAPYSYSQVQAVVYAQPPAPGNLPPAYAVYLYEPPAPTGWTSTSAVNHAGLACKNCPTFESVAGSTPSFYGIDGTLLSKSGGDTTAFESNGDMLLKAETTFCDPFGGKTCTQKGVVGTDGFALDNFNVPAPKVFCSGFKAPGSTNGHTSCSTTPVSGGFPAVPFGQLDGSEGGYAANAWTPTVDTTGLADCGTLVLDGDTVPNSLTTGSNPACFDLTDVYSIQPARYTSIVVNHGQYTFESGVYDITGTAPVNPSNNYTGLTNNTAGTYTAKGIDHSRETAVDFDLCSGPPVTNETCSLSAGVWIGHGSGLFAAAVTGSPAPCSGGTGGGSNGGGGDATIVSGTGVTFKLEPLAGGFVSTHEATTVGLTGPGPGASAAVGNAPLLFDLENAQFIHLDGSGSTTSGQGSSFGGIIYQARSATGGGVELNPGMTGSATTGALAGQVIAYSLTTFGTSGVAVDFSKGFGGAASAISTPTSGVAETQIRNGASFYNETDSKGVATGRVTFEVDYTDEWALDAYDTYVIVNGGPRAYFSQGIWANQNPAVQPPPDNSPNPDDQVTHAARHSPSLPGLYTISATDPNDWSLNSGASTFETRGAWTWGHERDIKNAIRANDLATIKYTFPAPAGSTTNITVFMTDGDRCGDYDLANLSFTNPGGGVPGGGTQVGPTVTLLQ